MFQVKNFSIFILVAPEESHSSSMGDLDEFLEDESTVSSIATKNYDIRPVSDPSYDQGSKINIYLLKIFICLIVDVEK